MFKFFEGALGEILAPVSGTSNILFLAIQQHKNDDLEKLLSSYEADGAKSNDNGTSPIHCACRYNNIVALNLLLSRGVAVNSPDSAGNKPLHYAAKHGHPELCKLLVGKGAFPGARNNTGQTAYDVADNHIVRQYLLPLQFQDERESSDSNGAMKMTPNNQSQAASGSYMAPADLPSSNSYSNIQNMANNGPTTYTSQQNQPPIDAGNNWGSSTPGPPPQQSPYRPPAPLSNGARIIQPDGFHTSASDPELQKKYGHTKNVIDIAPPPTFASMNANGSAVPPQQYSMYTKTNGQNPVAQPTINRYVAFDPYAPPASTQAAPVQQSQAPSPPPSLPSSYQPALALPASPIAPVISNFPQPPQAATPTSSSSMAHNVFQERIVETKIEPTISAVSAPLPSNTPPPAAPVIDSFLTSKPAEFIPVISSDSSQDEFCEVEILGSNSSSVL